MRNLKVRTILILASLLVAAMATMMAGCSGSDKPGSATSPLALPTVISVTPLDGSTLVCNGSATVTATFTKAMDPSTINTTTFTLTGPSGPVTGTVNYVAATNVATFTPASPPGLAVTTTYTA